MREAVRRALKQVQGAYAIVVMADHLPDQIVAAKNASPLVLGLGEGENFVASDIPAILQHTRQMIFLEEGEIAAVITGTGTSSARKSGVNRRAFASARVSSGF